jgi:beta-lactamase regulating signal transducer with metallopeptidase domain
MPILLGPELAVWFELLAVLGVGTSAAVALAAFVSRRMRSAVWERAVWQACTLTLLALVALELTGLGAAAVQLCVASWSGNRSDREMADAAFIGLLEDDSSLATHAHLTAANPALAAPAHTWWPAIVWAIGSLVLLVRMAWGRALLAVFRWRCRPLRDVSIRNRVQSIASRIGLRRAIQTLTSNSLRSPAVFHWLFPVLALPSRFSDDYSAAQQEAVLAHELAHLARRDPAWQSVAMLACAVLWWQPLSWWSSRRLRAASEAAADEASLMIADGPRELAASLVSLAQRLTDPHLATGTSMQGNGLQSDLARRVERLLSLPAGARLAPSKLRLNLAHGALPICFSVLCILCTAWAPSRRSFTQGDTTVNVLTSAWRSSLAATAMWMALGGGSRLPADEPLQDETNQARSENIQSPKRDAPRDQDRVREVLEALRQQVVQLKKEGKRDAAEAISKIAETMTRKFAERAEPPGADRSERDEQRLETVREQRKKLVDNDRQVVDRSEAIRQKLRAVREQAEKLAKEGKSEQAKKLMQEAEAMARKSEEEVRLQRAERSELIKQKLQAAREQVEQLQKHGDHNAAEKLMREAEAMARKFEADANRSLRTDQSEIAQQKLRETLDRVNQLRKRGDLEAAEKLAREAEPLTREFQERVRAQQVDRLKNIKLKLRATRERVEQLHEQGDHEAAEKLRREGEAIDRQLQEQDGTGRAEQSEVLQQKLKAIRERVDQLRKQGAPEAAEQAMREAEALARKYKEQVDSSRRDSSDDLRAGLRQLQRDLQELREQFRQLQEQRGSNRN